MKYLQVVIFSLGVVAISCRKMQVVMDCMNTHGVPMAEMKSFKPENPSDKQKCVAGCVALKLGFPNDIEPTFEKLSKRFNDDEKEILRECLSGVTAADDCQIGQEFYNCEQKAQGKA